MSTPPQTAFSFESRLALISDFFGYRKVEPAEAWKDVYRLLLWADPTTGLAHCYESDKAQPGRPWYARTLAFHAWLASEFEVTPAELADHLDWMFRHVIATVADREAERRDRLRERAKEQLAQFGAMPQPDDDPELRLLIDPLLPTDLGARPSDEAVRDVLRRVRTHIASENKRKNLLGRGFEDVLAGVVSRLSDGGPASVGTQVPIEEIPGFREPRTGDKGEKVDLWVGTRTGRRILVTAKWSVRADREKQMRGDYLTYVACNQRREPFEFVWITNEFDPARLVANASNTEGNSYLFTQVVHVCPEALRIVHDLNSPHLKRTTGQLREHLAAGRIIGLDTWLAGLNA